MCVCVCVCVYVCVCVCIHIYFIAFFLFVQRAQFGGLFFEKFGHDGVGLLLFRCRFPLRQRTLHQDCAATCYARRRLVIDACMYEEEDTCR